MRLDLEAAVTVSTVTPSESPGPPGRPWPGSGQVHYGPGLYRAGGLHPHVGYSPAQPARFPGPSREPVNRTQSVETWNGRDRHTGTGSRGWPVAAPGRPGPAARPGPQRCGRLTRTCLWAHHSRGPAAGRPGAHIRRVRVKVRVTGNLCVTVTEFRRPAVTVAAGLSGGQPECRGPGQCPRP